MSHECFWDVRGVGGNFPGKGGNFSRENIRKIFLGDVRGSLFGGNFRGLIVHEAVICHGEMYG